MPNEEIKVAEEVEISTTPVEETTNQPVTEEVTAEQSSTEMDFGAILEQFEQEQTAFSSGETVTGKIVGVAERGILVDFGYKSEGIVEREEFTNAEGEITAQVGDEIEVVIKSMESGDSFPRLSFLDAKRRRSWVEIEQNFRDEAIVTGKITGKTKGGLTVDLNGVEAFLPSSQIDSRPIKNLDSYIGQDIETKIIKCSRKRNNIVISRKVITDEVVNAQKAETLTQLREGYIIDGTIKNLTEYGAFVDLGGLDGLLHVTDMSWSRLQNPKDMFKSGDNVQVKILKFDKEKEKVSLGFKQLLPDPWETIAERYPVGATIKGKVSSATDYGAFIELETGVEGLVHVSEMSWSKRQKSPKQMVRNGDEVEVQVLGIDQNDRRISLGMKQLMPNPWESVISRYQIGSKVAGKVRNLTDFGAFVEIEDGVDGLVHVSDISHSKKIKHPKDVLKRGQDVEAVITKIDIENRRISMSIKDLTPSAWDDFILNNRPGTIVKGKISRFASFGVFVELGDELEGLCHISELSDERVEKAENIVQIGQEMDFKILRIESDVQKIGLSARAVGSEDDSDIDTKVYSTEAKGGMASLGELANLKFGSGSDEEEGEN
jgi:small subunit ribosomal protein S1